ncbi:MAG: hypothetical protein JO165_00730 [Candidatus Eremiobacteraeota bacterium]|nr:hypothetical protein [Candidatus Eremiobacteraeota bacterium]
MATRLQRQTGGMINQAVDRGTDLLADRIDYYVSVARDVADSLRQRGEAQPADLLETTIVRVDYVTKYLRDADGTQLYGDVRELTRDRTWLLAGAGFVTGLLAARAIRASAMTPQDEYVEQFDQRGTQQRG